EALPVAHEGAEPALLAAALYTAGALDLARGDEQGAEAWFKESLRVGPPNPYDTPRALEGLAITAVRRGQDDQALRLMSAAAALRQVRREPDPVWQRSVDGAADEARRRLGQSRSQAAMAAGYRLPCEQAVACALDNAWGEPGPDDAARHGLSERECEIARLVAEGMTNRKIAHQLAISPRTVDAHLHPIRDKLGLRSRAQVAAWVAKAAVV